MCRPEEEQHTGAGAGQNGALPAAAADPVKPPMAKDEDERRLNELGYEQEYRRQMSPFQQWAYTFSYTAPLGFCTGYYGYMYSYGGPVTIIWGFLATALGTLAMAGAMSEIISAFPTLGSVYYWVAQLVPRRHAAWLSWFTGWVYLLGSFCGTALNEYLLAQFIATMILLGTGGADGGGYQLSQSQVIGVTAGVFVVHFWVSIVNTPWLGRISAVGAWFQILSIVVIVAVMLAIVPKYQTGKFVFTHFVHAPGLHLQSPVMVVLLGLPYFQSILTGFEVGAHVVEETRHAATSGPNAMVRSVYCTAGVELVLLLVMGFCIQHPENVLGDFTATGGGDSSAGIQIFYDAWQARTGHGAAGAICFAGLAVGSLFFGNITNVTLTARMAYAMARDIALPCDRWLTTLTRKDRVPINATVLTVIVSFACTLPALGSSVAFTAITAMSTITAYLPYTVVLLCRHLFDNGFVPGPYNLGRYSIYIGLGGAAWGALMSVLFCLPPQYPITINTFNYAGPSFLICLAVGGLYYFTVGNKRYFGPVKVINAPPPDRV